MVPLSQIAFRQPQRVPKGSVRVPVHAGAGVPKGEVMAQSASINKTITVGEGGTALAFAALAVLSIIIAAKAWTPEYAFHAYLFCAASVAAVFAIANRYTNRKAEPVPQEIDGK